MCVHTLCACWVLRRFSRVRLFVTLWTVARQALLARILEWVSMPSSKWSSPSRDGTHISYISCIGSGVLYHWATWEIFKSKFLPQPPPRTSAGWGVGYKVLTALQPGSSRLQLPSSLWIPCLPANLRVYLQKCCKKGEIVSPLWTTCIVRSHLLGQFVHKSNKVSLGTQPTQSGYVVLYCNRFVILFTK